MRLPVLVAHDKAGVVEFFDGPGRQETAGRYSWLTAGPDARPATASLWLRRVQLHPVRQRRLLSHEEEGFDKRPVWVGPEHFSCSQDR
jgi:hypothetical protein